MGGKTIIIEKLHFPHENGILRVWPTGFIERNAIYKNSHLPFLRQRTCYLNAQTETQTLTEGYQ